MTEFPTQNNSRRPRKKKPAGRKTPSLAQQFRALPPAARKKLLAGLAGALVLVLVLIILFAWFLGREKSPSADSSSHTVSSAVSDNYDKDADKLDTDQLGNTILAQTEDAGQ